MASVRLGLIAFLILEKTERNQWTTKSLCKGVSSKMRKSINRFSFRYVFHSKAKLVGLGELTEKILCFEFKKGSFNWKKATQSIVSKSQKIIETGQSFLRLTN